MHGNDAVLARESSVDWSLYMTNKQAKSVAYDLSEIQRQYQ